jgi:hypothetical protein
MKYKIVIVETQTSTEMTVAGTVYFKTELEAKDFIIDHNVKNTSKAYLVNVSPNYHVIDN